MVRQDMATNNSSIMVSIHTNQDNTDMDNMDTMEIVCKVVTNQPVEIYWTVPGKDEQLHQQELSLLGRDKYSMEEVIIEGVVISTLMVEDVGENDEGIYR